MCAILGCTAQVCLLAAVLCGSPAIVYPLSFAPFIKRAENHVTGNGTTDVYGS